MTCQSARQRRRPERLHPDHHALDAEEDFDLVHPGGVDSGVDQDGVREPGGETVDCFLAAV